MFLLVRVPLIGHGSPVGTPIHHEVVCEALRLLHEREELFTSQREVLRSQIAEGVAAEERAELRNGAEAIADVRHRIDERLRRGE